MFGCLRRIGCLAVLAIAALLYVTRDSWRPAAASALRVSNRLSGHEDVAASTDTLATWQQLDQPAAERGERAVRTLAARNGPVYVNLRPGELASYAFLTLSDNLPPALRSAQTAVLGDRIYLRSVVAPADFAGVLGGPVRTLIHGRDTLRLGGTFDVVRPGLGQFRVRDVQIGAVPVPSALVPRIVARLRASSSAESGDAVRHDAIPVPLPPFVGDVRVGRGRITLYKNTP
jgi:hypothetical protein